MKKLVLLIIAVLFVSFTYFGTSFEKMSARLDGQASVYSTEKTNIEGYDSILNVEHYMTNARASELVKVVKKTKGVLGVSIKLRGSIENLDTYLKQYSAKIVKAQMVSGVQIYYAYSHRIQSKISLFGENVNLEIAFNDGMVTIGSPIIIGGY